MEIGHLVIGVIASIIGVFTLSFTVFWSLLRNVESRLCQKITEFGSAMMKCQDGRVRITHENDEKFTALFNIISKKVDFESCEANYVRKREHELEFNLLKEKLDNMQSDMKELKIVIENNNK